MNKCIFNLDLPVEYVGKVQHVFCKKQGKLQVCEIHILWQGTFYNWTINIYAIHINRPQ